MSQKTIIVVPAPAGLVEILPVVDQSVHVDPIRLRPACRGPPALAAC
jgi:hypothetical protein